jgi:hypothetical protein
MSVHKDSGEPRARRQGLVEYLIVLALFALAAVGTIAVFGDEVRAMLGIGPTHISAPASTGAPSSR